MLNNPKLDFAEIGQEIKVTVEKKKKKTMAVMVGIATITCLRKSSRPAKKWGHIWGDYHCYFFFIFFFYSCVVTFDNNHIPILIKIG